MPAYKGLCKKNGEDYYIAVKTGSREDAESLFRAHADKKGLEFVRMIDLEDYHEDNS